MGLDRQLEGRSIVLTGRTADADTTVEVGPAARGTLPTNEFIASVASTDNTNDKAAGTGGLTAIVRGIQKTTYVEAEELITLNGTTAVTTTAKFIRLNEVVLKTVGSNGSNTGTITASLNSQAQLTMPIGYSKTSGLYYAVPAGHFLAIDRINLSCGELATTNVVRAQVLIRDIGSSLTAPGPWYVMHEQDLFWSAIAPEFGHELVIPAKHEFKIVAATSVNNVIMSGSVVATLAFGNVPPNTLR